MSGAPTPPRKEPPLNLVEQFREYTFEVKHLLVIFAIMVFFLVIVSFVQKVSLQNMLYETQEWYQQDFAERLANLTATSLELLLETATQEESTSEEAARTITQAFNIILSQQALQQHVDEVGIILSRGENDIVITEGRELFAYFFRPESLAHQHLAEHDAILRLYGRIREEMYRREEIRSFRVSEGSFRVFVPFVPKGEVIGAVYVKNTPDFSFITREILANYDETALIFAALIMFGLLSVFYISSYLVKERDEVQTLLFQEREAHLAEQIEQEKESLFTKRIYHTHHKAEKVMGFIKEDLRGMTDANIEVVKERVVKYANFISRVIYDMKWYEPPVHAIRNPIFRTDLNAVITFIVEHIFQRIASNRQATDFRLELDPSLPVVSVNEFVVWEIIEPLVQNSLDHGGEENLLVRIRTACDNGAGKGCRLEIADNGRGIPEGLLEPNAQGIQRLFLENISSKTNSRNAGYGCYLAYEIARRCGWRLEAGRSDLGGSRFTLYLSETTGESRA